MTREASLSGASERLRTTSSRVMRAWSFSTTMVSTCAQSVSSVARLSRVV